jgi:hypothetical protein
MNNYICQKHMVLVQPGTRQGIKQSIVRILGNPVDGVRRTLISILFWGTPTPTLDSLRVRVRSRE